MRSISTATTMTTMNKRKAWPIDISAFSESIQFAFPIPIFISPLNSYVAILLWSGLDKKLKVDRDHTDIVENAKKVCAAGVSHLLFPAAIYGLGSAE